MAGAWLEKKEGQDFLDRRPDKWAMRSMGCRSNIYKSSLSFADVVSFFLSHGKDISLLAVYSKSTLCV